MVAGRGPASGEPPLEDRLTTSLEPLPQERFDVAAAQRGDLAAFNRLVESYQRLAYNVAYRTVGNTDEAADATQEAFLSAFRAIHEFRGASFKSWLLRIVVNACYDQLRRRRRQPADSLDALTDEQAREVEPADPAPSPELAALGRETAEAIQRALDRLPAEQRLVAVLCDVHGFSYEEAAATLDLAVGTIKSRLSRGRARLRDELAARGELPAALRRPQDEGPLAS